MDGRVASASDITLSFGRSSSLEEIKDSVQSAPDLSNLQLFQCACVNDDSISELVSVINPHLKGFEASNIPSITTAAIRVLSEHCRELRSVKFISCHRLDRHCLKILGTNCRKLRSVSFLNENKDDGWRLQDSALSILVENISSNLQAAAFVGFEDIADDALLNISKHFGRTVIELDFSGNHKITDYGLRTLATRCKQLRSLALSNTSITDKGIHYLADNCRHLRKLNVSGCRDISDQGLIQIARKCSKLECIVARKCYQTSDESLQELIKNCTHLQQIDLSETSVALIDRCLSESEIQHLRANMCKELPHPPPDIISEDADCISNSQVNPAHRRRVLILGEPGCGKSTLVKLLCSSLGAHNGDDSSDSDGMNIELIQPFKDSEHDKLLDRKLDEDDQSLVLEIWDVSKRRIWQQCQSLFLLQESVCVLVFNLSEKSSCQSVPQQLELIKSKSPSSHVIIIGTHDDKLEEPGQHKEVICEEILEEIRKRQEHRKDELKKELDILNDLPGMKCPMISQKIRQLKDIITKYKVPSEILTTNSNTQDLDDIKKSIFRAVLHATHQSNGLNENIKEAMTKCYEQISTLIRENNVVISTDMLYKDQSVAGEKKNTNSKRGKRRKSKQEHEFDREKQLEYLKAAGVVLEVPQCNRVTSVSSSSQSFDTNSLTETDSATSPSKSKEHESPNVSSPVHSKDQTNPVSKPSLLCVNPNVLAQSIFAIHVDDTKKAFKFEANRFWPKLEGAKKPNPSVLVHALEEVATQGLIRECIFPLLWQNLNLNEAQTRLLIDFLCSLGILVRETLPASGEPDCQCLKLPHYSNLSTQQQYRLPLLGLLMEQGPSLNWTPKPFQGDIGITWRYEILGSDIPSGMITRLLAFCRNQCPAQAVYQHYWNNGVLMKMGQAYIHMSRSADSPYHINFTGRVTTDEEGDHKATEFLWIALSHFLLCAQQYLHDWPGLEYKVTLLPSKAYYTSSKAVEIPLLVCIQMLTQGQIALDVVAEEDTQCQVKLNTMLPLIGDPAYTMKEWLTWLSVQPAIWVDHIPSPEKQEIDEEKATDGGDESSLGASPKAEASPNRSTTQEERPIASPPSKVDKIVAKKEIKWDLGGPKITEEDQIKEAKKVAATFVAAILAGAMAQYISEEIKGPGAEAAAKASAQAAKAAQIGDPEAAAKAVIAAALSVTNGKNNANGNGVTKVIRSKMCAII